MDSLDRILSLKSLENKKLFPFTAVTLISGSEVSSSESLKVRNPEKPERITNKAAVPTITPNDAMMVMILIALLLLFASK